MSIIAASDLPLRYSIRQPRLKIRRPPLLILLHGIGSNETDFMNLFQDYDGRFLLLSLRAPFSQTAGSSTWFNIVHDRGSTQSTVPQAEYSREIVVRLIPEAVQKFKANPGHVYLMGFSQGAVVALGVLMTQPQLVSGVVAMSGQVLPEIRSVMAAPERLKNKQLLLIHGLQDAFYPISLCRSSHALLSTLPIDLEYHEYYMGHNLTQESLTKAREWLSRQLDLHGVIGLPDGPDYAVKLAGIHLKVRNIERSISFYARFLGMQLVERTGKTYAFLTNDQSHHVIVLENVGEKATLPGSGYLGLQRVSFSVPDPFTFAQAYKALLDGDLSVSAIDQTVSWTLQFQDPDGNGLQIILDTRDLPGRPHLWQGRDLPLDVDKIYAYLPD